MNYILKNNLNVESNYTKTANSILIDSPLRSFMPKTQKFVTLCKKQTTWI